MISRLIRQSFFSPLLTALLIAAGTVIGGFWIQDLRRDVFPDLSAPVFNVIAQNPAMGAEELERAIAIPLEVALAGLPDVRRVRSNSQLGVAQVTIEFDPDADYYRSRQFVAERVGQVTGQLPPGTDAPLISSLTGRLNEIFEFTLSRTGRSGPDERATWRSSRSTTGCSPSPASPPSNAWAATCASSRCSSTRNGSRPVASRWTRCCTRWRSPT
jgi:Cu/Ag efflux pump CusA